MYAESFNVRAWLEEPAKWLRWARQSGAAGNLDHERYNLQQFWKSLQTYKGRAKTQLDWYELMTLDASSQEALGNHLRRIVEGLQQQLAGAAGKAGVGSTVGAGAGAVGGGLLVAAGASAATGVGIPLAAGLAIAAGIVAGAAYVGSKTGEKVVMASVPKVKDAILRKSREAADAYRAAEKMAADAEAAYRKSGSTAPQQVTALKKTAAAKRSEAEDLMIVDRSDLERNSAVSGFFGREWLGLPTWVWLGGAAAAAALLLMTGGSNTTIKIDGAGQK